MPRPAAAPARRRLRRLARLVADARSAAVAAPPAGTADPAQACTDEAARITGTPESEPLAALAEAVRTYAASDRAVADTQQLDTAMEAFAASVDGLWGPIVDQLGQVDGYLADKGE